MLETTCEDINMGKRYNFYSDTEDGSVLIGHMLVLGDNHICNRYSDIKAPLKRENPVLFTDFKHMRIAMERIEFSFQPGNHMNGTFWQLIEVPAPDVITFHVVD